MKTKGIWFINLILSYTFVIPTLKYQIAFKHLCRPTVELSNIQFSSQQSYFNL